MFKKRVAEASVNIAPGWLYMHFFVTFLHFCHGQKVYLFSKNQSVFVEKIDRVVITQAGCVNSPDIPAKLWVILYGHSDTYIGLHKSCSSVRMPVKVHSAHVHFMVEHPAL